MNTPTCNECLALVRHDRANCVCVCHERPQCPRHQAYVDSCVSCATARRDRQEQAALAERDAAHGCGRHFSARRPGCAGCQTVAHLANTRAAQAERAIARRNRIAQEGN